MGEFPSHGAVGAGDEGAGDVRACATGRSPKVRFDCRLDGLDVCYRGTNATSHVGIPGVIPAIYINIIYIYIKK